MELDSQQVFAKVAGALAEVLGTEEEAIAPQAKLVTDLEASSLDVVDILFQLKRIFGIELTLSEVQRELSGGETGAGFNDALFDGVTVQDVANWVVSRLPA
jgi:acyl carrier protein